MKEKFSQHNAFAIFQCVMGVMCYCIGDAIAKSLIGHYSPFQLLFLRSAIAVITILAIGFPFMRHRLFKTSNLLLHAFRGLAGVAGAGVLFTSFASIPLATATAISFSAPLFLVVFSVLFFRERVNLRQWSSLLIGFAGVIVALHPSAEGLESGSLYALLAAVFYAVMMISARALKNGDSMMTLIFYIAFGQLLSSSVFQLWVWRPIEVNHLPKIVALAFFSTAGLSLMSNAFRLAPAAIVSPIEYTGLIWAALLGWFIWHESMDMTFMVGAGMIILSGIIITTLKRENKVESL
jgi:drug/metabolite transporter (DMT)-like permease